eukprot:148576-Pelagomonas_calceolata.AAC.1
MGGLAVSVTRRYGQCGSKRDRVLWAVRQQACTEIMSKPQLSVWAVSVRSNAAEVDDSGDCQYKQDESKCSMRLSGSGMTLWAG